MWFKSRTVIVTRYPGWLISKGTLLPLAGPSTLKDAGYNSLLLPTRRKRSIG